MRPFQARKTQQIIDGGASSDIERVLACAFIGALLPLNLIDARQRVLDCRAAAEGRSPFGRAHRDAQLLHEGFLRMQRDRTAIGGRGAGVAQLARPTGLGGKLHRGAGGHNRRGVVGGAFDDAVGQSNRERLLREPLAIARGPGFRVHGDPARVQRRISGLAK